MGATSALIFATRNPEKIDGVIALCPATDVAEMYPIFADEIGLSYGGSPEAAPAEYIARRSRDHTTKLTGKRVAIVHGDADAIIPVTHSRALTHPLKSENLLYIEIPGGDHDAPISYPPSELMEFVLRESRSKWAIFP